jgi:hypothetical protein
LVLLIVFSHAALAQSTEALISGRVADILTKRAIEGAAVTCVSEATSTARTALTDSEGLYALTPLPPGTYLVRVSIGRYQSQEVDELTLGVAESLDLNFSLRPVADLWESAMQGSVKIPSASILLNFYGPDVDPNHWTAFAANTGLAGKLEASLSDSIRPADIRELPLNGNNVYAILLAEPGVTADNATSRSLGIAANGQRPSSSNYLLDGVEANFYLVGGPLVSVAPESIQEYRLSTNNFSAEYGGAAGYLANAVTRSGGNHWHGIAYFDLENTIFNANDFQNNVGGLAPTPSRQNRTGGFVGGPIWKRVLFSGTSLEYFRSRSQMQPQQYALPSTAFLSYLNCPSSNYACQLLRNYPVPSAAALVGSVTLTQPVSVNQWLGLERFDFSPESGAQHLSVRAMGANLSRPDFIWSPYPDYVSGLDQPIYNLAANWTRVLNSATTNALSAGWNDESVSWDRAHANVPTLVAQGVPGETALLPGSPAAYGLNDSSRYLQVYDTLTAIKGRHILKFGAGLLGRSTSDNLSFGVGGEYFFCNLLHFGVNLPCATARGEPAPGITFEASLARGASLPVLPNLGRSYRSWQSFAFAHDTFRVSSRLVIDFGLRLDYFGAPSYNGAEEDWRVQFGTGSTFDQRVAGASLVAPSNSSAVFSGGGPNFAPRLGFGYEILPSLRATLRGGFGLFYDRLFDNLWLNARNNSFVFPAPVPVSTYLPVSQALAAYSPNNSAADFPLVTAFQPHLRNGYAEDFFIGAQMEPLRGWSIEADGTGSLGRRLITNDVLNWNSLLNPSLPAITYLSNQGLSDYYGLNLVSRWRSRYGFLQAAYTWSHAIDLQSDPLAGPIYYFNLDFVNTGPVAVNQQTASAFPISNDSRGDRGNADFDQRHTFVFFAWWQVPQHRDSIIGKALSGLRFSQLAAFRSGFPYSIFTPIATSTPELVKAYARPLSGNPLLANPIAVPGGEQIFQPAAFCADDSCGATPSGRNAFSGPGLLSLDVSLSRSFALRWIGESGSLVVRADAFNFLNHANLNPPGNVPGSSNFGIALFGTPPQASGFPSIVPLAETARVIQLTIRVNF